MLTDRQTAFQWYIDSGFLKEKVLSIATIQNSRENFLDSLILEQFQLFLPIHKIRKNFSFEKARYMLCVCVLNTY